MKSFLTELLLNLVWALTVVCFGSAVIDMGYNLVPLGKVLVSVHIILCLFYSAVMVCAYYNYKATRDLGIMKLEVDKKLNWWFRNTKLIILMVVMGLAGLVVLPCIYVLVVLFVRLVRIGVADQYKKIRETPLV